MSFFLYFLYNRFTTVRPHVSLSLSFSLVDVFHVAVVYVDLHRDFKSSDRVQKFFLRTHFIFIC